MTPLSACKLRTARSAIDRWRDLGREEAQRYRRWAAELCTPGLEPEARQEAFDAMNEAQCWAAMVWDYLAELLGMVGELEKG